jgi:hypothetical protein
MNRTYNLKCIFDTETTREANPKGATPETKQKNKNVL